MANSEGGFGLHYFPPYQHSQNLYRRLCGSMGGLLEGAYYDAPLFPGKAQMATVSGEIPAYHRLLLSNPNMEISYHLSGYGLAKHEALTRLAGESVERYAGLIAGSCFQDRQLYRSLNQLRAAGLSTISPQLLQMYAPQQRQHLAQITAHNGEPVDADTALLWSPCQSYYQQQTIWVPNQFLYLAAGEGEPLLSMAVSTGTAAHRTLEAAMLGGLVEYLHIHFFNLVWYGGLTVHRVQGRSPALEQIFQRLRLEDDYCLSSYYCNATQTQLPPIICTIIQHRRQGEPYLLCGIQCDFHLEKAILRSAMEAHAIVYSGIYQGIEGRFQDTDKWKMEDFLDLDSNVLHYCNPRLAESHRQAFASWENAPIISFEELARNCQAFSELRSPQKQLSQLLQLLQPLAPQACYQVITPPELIPQGWQVVRSFLPEFLPICLPGHPPLQHPAYQHWTKGVVHFAPHPLP